MKRFLDDNGIEYKESDDDERLRTKAKKLRWLRRAIALVGTALGEDVSFVRPSKVAAGKDVSSTLQWLRLLAKAATLKSKGEIDSASAVRAVLRSSSAWQHGRPSSGESARWLDRQVRMPTASFLPVGAQSHQIHAVRLIWPLSSRPRR